MARTDGILDPTEVITVEELDQVPNNSMIYKDNAGSYQEVPLGTNGEVLKSNGNTLAPSFQTGGIGDMLQATYDPSTIEKDLFATSQTVYVNKVTGDDTGGNGSVNAPFATIQFAIDNTTGNTVFNISPDTYNEDLTLRDNVILNGPIASITGKIICNGLNFFQSIRLTRSSTVTETFIDAITNVCNIFIDYSTVTLTTATDNIQPKIMHIGNGSSILFSNSDAIYTNTSTAPNSALTSSIKVEGTGSFTYSQSNLLPTISQSSGDHIMIDEASTVIYTSFGVGYIGIVAHPAYSGTMAVHRTTSAGIDKRIGVGQILMFGAGSGTGVAFILNSGGGSAILKALNNSISITGFTNNLHADIQDNSDTLESFNEESNALDGVIGNGSYEQDPLWNFFNGSIEEKVDFTVTSDGVTILANIEKLGGGDLTLRYSTGRIKFDCTPISTVELTPGTDTVPLKNYVFILRDTGLLTSNTTGFPVDQHSRIGLVGCQSAVSVQADGPMLIQSTQDSLHDPEDNGHLSHINEWIREQLATYVDGMVESNSGSGTATVNIGLTSGNIFQLHKNSSPDHPSPATTYIVNDSVTPFRKEANLATILTDSLGATLNNKYFAIVLWQNVSSIGSNSKLMINLPSGSYASEADARADGDKVTNFSIPGGTKNAGVLVHRYICRSSSGSLTIFPGAGDDLRGTLPNTAGGSSTSVGTVFQDGTFRVENTADNTKVLALDVSLVSTGVTRTLIIPNKDGTVATLSDITGTNSGTNTGDVTLVGTPNYLTIVGQVITRALINLTSHVTGILPIVNGGTGSSIKNFVDLTGLQTIGGVKIFSNSLIIGDSVVFNEEFDNGNSGTSDIITWTIGQKQKSTLTGNVTFLFNAPNGVGNFVLKLIQDATGSRTVTWPATVKWAGGTAPTLTTTANAIDIVSFYYDGTNYYGQSGLNFS